jgi:hypothetical protein
MIESEYLKKRDDLFERWKRSRPEYEGEENRFTIDGIVNYDDYVKSRPKILFLLNENHAAPDDWEPCWGIDFYNNEFSKNVARWRHLLKELLKDVNQELSFENVEFNNPIKDVAFLEIKKLNERKSKSDYNEIMAYAEKDSDYIKEEIELIDPDIVFCGSTGDAYANYLYFNEDGWETLISLSNCSCKKDGNRLIIDFYHPSTFTEDRSNELFEILCKMIKEGKVFEKFNWSNKIENINIKSMKYV